MVSVLPDSEDYVGCAFDSDKITVSFTLAVGSSLILSLWVSVCGIFLKTVE
jgi:hypothetical protein